MSMRKTLKRAVAACLFCCLLLSALPVSANSYYTDGRIIVASEPEQLSKHLEYYVGGKKADPSEIEWTEEGHTGKGIVLNGTDRYLRLVKRTVQVRAFTFAGWINWKGAADAENPDGACGQYLFTVANKQKNWLTFSPHMQDAEKKINGIYLGHKLGNQQTDMFKEADAGVSYSLPVGEWHHVAVVLSETAMCLYIDGVPYLSVPKVTYLGDLNATGMYIGRGADEAAPLLNAVIDDMFIYEYDLTEEQVLRLYHGIDPKDTETELPTDPTEPLPTAPTVTTTVTVPSGPVTSPQTFFSSETGWMDIPLWGLRWIGYLLAGVAVLSVAFSIYEIRRRRRR